MGKLVFVTGGSRSGKTMFAQRLAESWEGRLLYVATAEARDAEMERRIAAHRADRGERWSTLEEPLDLAGAVSRFGGYGGVLVDCLTLWTSNLIEAHREDDVSIDARVDGFLAALTVRPANVVVVTNETGQGIVPMDPLARRFRDLAGRINRKVSLAADEAYLVVAGRVLTLEKTPYV